MEPKIKVMAAEKTYTAREWVSIAIGFTLLLFGFVSCARNALTPMTCDQAMSAKAEADAHANSAVSWGMRSNATDKNKMDAESAIRKQQETLYDVGKACH